MKPNRQITGITFKGASVLLLAGAVFFVFQSSCRTSNAEKADYRTRILELPPATPLEASESASLQEACQNWYDKYLAKSHFNGGVLVAKGGNIIFEQYKGESKLGSGLAFGDTTPIHIASVSKTFTAMAVLKLCEEGRLKLEDPLSKYFPAFTFPDITIRTLLNHRSGLPNYTGFMDESDWNKSVALRNEDVLQYLITKKKTLPNWGRADRSFSYCNTNFALLALLVEQITGNTFADFLQQRFFGPLDMKHTFVRTDADSIRVNPSYEANGRLIPDNYMDKVYGDKNIYSTPRDLFTWERALRSGLLFKPETLAAAYTPYSNEKPGRRNYGLGWRLLGFPEGGMMIYHNGWWHGNNASFLRLPEDEICIIALGSRFTKLVYKTKDLVSVFNEKAAAETEE
jgi:CubicO group peptidase (beta-lactamase class C family)